MVFSEKISVLELIIHLLKENGIKLEGLIENMEIVENTIQKEASLLKTLNEYDLKSEPHLQSILVVDDDRNLANTFKLVLESVGYNVDTANTGVQAIYRMKQRPYDLVLLDLKLPDTRGDMVAEMIEERYFDVNIVFITGYVELMSEVEKTGDDKEVLLKPIVPENLIEVASRNISAIK